MVELSLLVNPASQNFQYFLLFSLLQSIFGLIDYILGKFLQNAFWIGSCHITSDQIHDRAGVAK